MRTISSWRASFFCIILLLTAVHASATLVPLQVQVYPPGENLIGGTPVNISGELGIIPSGATTFAETHTLSLSTDLSDARWHVVVYIDGVQGAVIPKEGNRVYVNGFLLSYPTTRDVSVRILLDGTVPTDAASSDLMVLRFAELNSQGNIVSESENKVSLAMTNSGTQSIPSLTEAQSHVATPADKVPLSCIPACGAFLLVSIFLYHREKDK